MVILLLVPLVSLIAGLIIFIKPVSCIDFQKKFYEMINWRIEPIDMQMEIRNTRAMGLFLIVAAVAAAIFIFAYTPAVHKYPLTVSN